jgi:type II secretory pathway pseudopilin PulG
MHRYKAFTLLEVVAALLILGTCIVAVLALQGGSLETTRRIKELWRAHAAAEAAMDSFLTQPVFEADNDGTIDSQTTVTLDGFPADEFDITRILREHQPLIDQDTLEVDPDAKEAALTNFLGTAQSASSATTSASSSRSASGRTAAAATSATAAASTTDENLFDPGIFIAVRIEVRRHGSQTPLVVLETWLPKPDSLTPKLSTAQSAIR